MGYLAKRKHEEQERYFIFFLLMLIPVVTLLSTLGRSLDWRLDYLGEFKVQAALLSAVLFLWCLIKRHWYSAGIFLLLAVFNLALVSSHYHLTEKESDLPPEAHSFTIMYQDLQDADNKTDVVRNTLDHADADIVLWTNVPLEIYRHLNEIKGAYTLQNQTFDKQGNMMLILALTPSTARGQIDNNTGIWLSRVVGTRKLTMVLTSLGNPWSEQNYFEAEKKVNGLADFAKGRDEPVVLVGGFSAAGWSYLLKNLETEGGLSPQGTVVLTYPADFPFFMRRPTDHIYTHPGIEVVDLKTTQSIGTKRLGLEATIKIAPEKREVEFYELQPVISEQELLQPPL